MTISAQDAGAIHEAPVIRLPTGRLLIDGQLVEPLRADRTIDVINPANGRVITQIPACGPEEVDRAVQAAQRCFESREWRSMRPIDRGRLLERLALLVEEHADELAELEALDSGKLIGVTRAIDLAFTIDGLRYFAGWKPRSSAITSRCRRWSRRRQSIAPIPKGGRSASSPVSRRGIFPSARRSRRSPRRSPSAAPWSSSHRRRRR